MVQEKILKSLETIIEKFNNLQKGNDDFKYINSPALCNNNNREIEVHNLDEEHVRIKYSNCSIGSALSLSKNSHNPSGFQVKHG